MSGRSADRGPSLLQESLPAGDRERQGERSFPASPREPWVDFAGVAALLPMIHVATPLEAGQRDTAQVRTGPEAFGPRPSGRGSRPYSPAVVTTSHARPAINIHALARAHHSRSCVGRPFALAITDVERRRELEEPGGAPHRAHER